MKIEVLLFASLRDRAGSPSVVVEIESGGTVAALRATLAASHPTLAEGLATSRIAVDNEFRTDEFTIGEGTEVAVIPPVSGG